MVSDTDILCVLSVHSNWDNTIDLDAICNISFVLRVAKGLGVVVAQWINPGLNLLAAAVVPLGKALYPHCLVPRKGLKSLGPQGPVS